MKIVLVFPVNHAAFGVAGPHMQIFSTLCRLGHSVYPSVEGDTLRVVRELKPDFVLATVGIWGQEASEVQKVSPLVYYSGDEVVNFNSYVAAKPLHIFSHAKYWTEKFNEAGVSASYLPWGVDECIYYPEHLLEYNFDVVFVGGSVYPKRWQAWELLRKTGFKVNVWNTAHTKGLDFASVRQIYSTAKIVLAPAYFDEASPQVERGHGIPCRVFEAAACKAFQIVRNWEDLEEVFPQVVKFDSLDEMVDLVRFYLDPANQEIRQRIAKECYESVCKEHTYSHRMQKLIEVIEQKL